MKNVLIVTTVGGFLYKFEKHNAKILQELGYTVHYASNMKEQHYLYDEKELTHMGIHMHHIDIARSPYLISNNLRALRQLINIIKENSICAIHCHEPVGGLLGRLAGRHFAKKGICVLYTAHGFHFYAGAPLINNTLYYLAEKVLAYFTDYLVVINREDYVNGKKLHLKSGGSVYQIPGVGLDMEEFAPLSARERKEMRKKAGIAEEDFFIVSVGELNQNKNQSIIFSTLLTMKRHGKDMMHIKYGICGKGFYENRVRSWIQRFGLEQNVIMYGYCRNVREILGCADVFVLPSIREGLGMAGLEALSMGIPLVAADNRGTREYMQPGVNGLVCGGRDVNGWIEAIEKVRNLSPLELKTMKVNCRNSARPFEKANTEKIMRNVYNHMDEQVRGKNAYEPGCVN